MTIGSYNTSFQQVEGLLKNIKFLRQKGIKSINTDGVSEEFKHASQKQDYFKAYQAALRNFDYDFLLPDQSFFQFEFKPSRNNTFQDIRFAYFQNPQEFKTYSEYLEVLRERNIIQEEDDDEVGDTFQEEYEQFLLEQQFNMKFSTIRYDVDLGNYRPLIHSVAHIHIGYQNDIRIPCNKILTPLKFTLFVLKHSYYPIWRDLIENNNSHIENGLKIAKTVCEELIPSHWSENEKKELFII